MDRVLQLAEHLGKAIAESDQASKLSAARAELDKHDDLKKLLNEFRLQNEKVGRLEADNKSVEVEDKHKLQEIHDKLVANEVFKRFTAAQVDYVDLMRKVNESISAQLHKAEGKQ